MLRLIIFLFTLSVSLYSASMQTLSWKDGQTFLGFLNSRNLPASLFYDLDDRDKTLMQEINSGLTFDILQDENNITQQVLIPIGEELQVHIYQSDNRYHLKIIPIIYTKKTKTELITIVSSLNQDVFNTTQNDKLARAIQRAYKKSINFKKIKVGDRIVLKYTQKYRLNRLFLYPKILAIVTEINKKKKYLFSFKGKFYDKNGKDLEKYFMVEPCRYKRISDPFTYKRWHPIKKIYRPHLGVDYAAKKGTPVYAAADGRITFIGRKGGYGKTVEIRHQNGYKTLYAHLNRFAKIKKGQYVKKKYKIAYIGSTGLSTGAHLHFGLYRYKKAINPYKIIKKTKVSITSRYKRAFKYTVYNNTKELNKYLH